MKIRVNYEAYLTKEIEIDDKFYELVENDDEELLNNCLITCDALIGEPSMRIIGIFDNETNECLYED